MGVPYKDRMYPPGNITRQIQVDDDTYDVVLRPPTWEEQITAEGRANVLLREVVKAPVNEKGVPLPLPPHERRVVNMQIGVELAKLCVISIGGVLTTEKDFWKRQPAPIMSMLGIMLMDVAWETEVGRKNSKPLQSPRKILRKTLKSAPGTQSATPSSEGSTSSPSSSATATVSMTSGQ